MDNSSETYLFYWPEADIPLQKIDWKKFQSPPG